MRFPTMEELRGLIEADGRSARTVVDEWIEKIRLAAAKARTR